MNLREAAQMALQALQESKPIDINDPTAFYRSAHAIEGLRTLLAQPEREWQGLTNEEQMQVAWSCGAMSADWLDFARAIEAKLKEKNS